MQCLRNLQSSHVVPIFGAAILAANLCAADTPIANLPASEGRAITPAGELLRDASSHEAAVGALPVDFIRSPDHDGPDGAGRYLISINSGFGVQFSAATNRAQQSLSVIDLNGTSPVVVQSVYFPAPQSSNVGIVFGAHANGAGAWPLYVAGGVENRIWQFQFKPGATTPITPTSPGPDSTVTAPAIDLTSIASQAPSKHYNDGRAPVYPTGLALSADGSTLYSANNLDDSLAVITHLTGPPHVERVALNTAGQNTNLYPYGVRVAPAAHGADAKIYVSLWATAAIAVVDANSMRVRKHISVGRHPTAMLLNRDGTRLYVVNSNADAVSVIDTRSDVEVERIDVRLAEGARIGASPEGLAMDASGTQLFVTNAHANAIAVIDLGNSARGMNTHGAAAKSKVAGYIPTGQYPAAIAVVGKYLIVGNGKGTGFANSSLHVDNSGRAPNAPNYLFPASHPDLRGQYDVALIAGNFSHINLPDAPTLAAHSRQVMRNDGLLGKSAPLKNKPPISHIIYIIRENRTYDQVFGDVEHAGDGSRADGDATLAVFGAGDTARRHDGARQNVTPNAHALAQRFGLLDRFFVNSEASPDGHNWATAAFSNDYIDKAFRWDYSGRGRSYDYEGFNRLPSIEGAHELPGELNNGGDANTLTKFMKRFVPYLNGGRDIGEPETLYLWDAVQRAGLTYRNYGEFVATASAADVQVLNDHKAKTYPDTSPVVVAFATKKTLEGHFAATFPNFDLTTPDSMTTESYLAARRSGRATEALITMDHDNAKLRGTSRLGIWLNEFKRNVADRERGKGDHLPNLSIVRFSNDHTSGLRPGLPTPQFAVADNDFALGELVAAVSNSPYWKDTAIFVVEDDAQAGPDHVDAHRSPALVISAYNKPGALVHEYHNTVSLIRTMELLLGLPPMNQLDAAAAPIDIFRSEADLTPFASVLPELADNNLLVPTAATSSAMALWMQRSATQDFAHADMADARTLNEVIWFSVRGDGAHMPAIASLPAFDLMIAGLVTESDADDREDAVAAVDKRRARLIAALRR